MYLSRLKWAAAVMCLTAACVGSPPLPFQPSPRSELQIRGTTLLMPGARGRLSAWLSADKELRDVSWAVEGDAVSITNTGVVLAQRLGSATVRASYEGYAGTTTVHVVDSVAGIWRGSIVVVDCWPTHDTASNVCQGLTGVTAPLVLNVSQRAAADMYDNLSAEVDVFTPPAHGDFIGAVDSSGLFFLDGNVERPDGSMSGAVKFRWTREKNQLVPFTVDGHVEDRIDVQLSVRSGSSSVLVNEIWQLLPMTR